MIKFLSQQWIKNKRVFAVGLFGFIVLTYYTNCSSYQDSSLFDANDSASLTTVATYDNRLFAPAQGISVEALENMINVAGECNISQGTSYYIDLRLIATNAANTPYRVREDGTCTANPNDPECYRVKVMCNYGRYYANLPVGTWVPSAKTGCAYFLRGQLVEIVSGVEKRENKNLFNLPAMIYDNVNNNCPW